MNRNCMLFLLQLWWLSYVCSSSKQFQFSGETFTETGYRTKTFCSGKGDCIFLNGKETTSLNRLVLREDDNYDYKLIAEGFLRSIGYLMDKITDHRTMIAQTEGERFKMPESEVERLPLMGVRPTLKIDEQTVFIQNKSHDLERLLQRKLIPRNKTQILEAIRLRSDCVLDGNETCMALMNHQSLEMLWNAMFDDNKQNTTARISIHWELMFGKLGEAEEVELSHDTYNSQCRGGGLCDLNFYYGSENGERCAEVDVMQRNTVCVKSEAPQLHSQWMPTRKVKRLMLMKHKETAMETGKLIRTSINETHCFVKMMDVACISGVCKRRDMVGHNTLGFEKSEPDWENVKCQTTQVDCVLFSTEGGQVDISTFDSQSEHTSSVTLMLRRGDVSIMKENSIFTLNGKRYKCMLGARNNQIIDATVIETNMTSSDSGKVTSTQELGVFEKEQGKLNLAMITLVAVNVVTTALLVTNCMWQNRDKLAALSVIAENIAPSEQGRAHRTSVSTLWVKLMLIAMLCRGKATYMLCGVLLLLSEMAGATEVYSKGDIKLWVNKHSEVYGLDAGNLIYYDNPKMIYYSEFRSSQTFRVKPHEDMQRGVDSLHEVISKARSLIEGTGFGQLPLVETNDLRKELVKNSFKIKIHKAKRAAKVKRLSQIQAFSRAPKLRRLLRRKRSWNAFKCSIPWIGHSVCDEKKSVNYQSQIDDLHQSIVTDQGQILQLYNLTDSMLDMIKQTSLVQKGIITDMTKFIERSKKEFAIFTLYEEGSMNEINAVFNILKMLIRIINIVMELMPNAGGSLKALNAQFSQKADKEMMVSRDNYRKIRDLLGDAWNFGNLAGPPEYELVYGKKVNFTNWSLYGSKIISLQFVMDETCKFNSESGICKLDTPIKPGMYNGEPCYKFDPLYPDGPPACNIRPISLDPNWQDPLALNIELSIPKVSSRALLFKGHPLVYEGKEGTYNFKTGQGAHLHCDLDSAGEPQDCRSVGKPICIELEDYWDCTNPQLTLWEDDKTPMYTLETHTRQPYAARLNFDLIYFPRQPHHCRLYTAKIAGGLSRLDSKDYYCAIQTLVMLPINSKLDVYSSESHLITTIYSATSGLTVELDISVSEGFKRMIESTANVNISLEGDHLQVSNNITEAFSQITDDLKDLSNHSSQIVNKAANTILTVRQQSVAFQKKAAEENQQFDKDRNATMSAIEEQQHYNNALVAGLATATGILGAGMIYLFTQDKSLTTAYMVAAEAEKYPVVSLSQNYSERHMFEMFGAPEQAFLSSVFLTMVACTAITVYMLFKRTDRKTALRRWFFRKNTTLVIGQPPKSGNRGWSVRLVSHRGNRIECVVACNPSNNETYVHWWENEMMMPSVRVLLDIHLMQGVYLEQWNDGYEQRGDYTITQSYGRHNVKKIPVFYTDIPANREQAQFERIMHHRGVKTMPVQRLGKHIKNYMHNHPFSVEHMVELLKQYNSRLYRYVSESEQWKEAVKVFEENWGSISAADTLSKKLLTIVWKFHSDKSTGGEELCQHTQKGFSSGNDDTEYELEQVAIPMTELQGQSADLSNKDDFNATYAFCVFGIKFVELVASGNGMMSTSFLTDALPALIGMIIGHPLAMLVMPLRYCVIFGLQLATKNRIIKLIALFFGTALAISETEKNMQAAFIGCVDMYNLVFVILVSCFHLTSLNTAVCSSSIQGIGLTLFSIALDFFMWYMVDLEMKQFMIFAVVDFTIKLAQMIIVVSHILESRAKTGSFGAQCRNVIFNKKWFGFTALSTVSQGSKMVAVDIQAQTIKTGGGDIETMTIVLISMIVLLIVISVVMTGLMIRSQCDSVKQKEKKKEYKKKMNLYKREKMDAMKDEQNHKTKFEMFKNLSKRAFKAVQMVAISGKDDRPKDEFTTTHRSYEEPRYVVKDYILLDGEDETVINDMVELVTASRNGKTVIGPRCLLRLVKNMVPGAYYLYSMRTKQLFRAGWSKNLCNRELDYEVFTGLDLASKLGHGVHKVLIILEDRTAILVDSLSEMNELSMDDVIGLVAITMDEVEEEKPAISIRSDGHRLVTGTKEKTLRDVHFEDEKHTLFDSFSTEADWSRRPTQGNFYIQWSDIEHHEENRLDYQCIDLLTWNGYRKSGVPKKWDIIQMVASLQNNTKLRERQIEEYKSGFAEKLRSYDIPAKSDPDFDDFEW